MIAAFEVSVPVYQSDSVKELAVRIAKEVRSIKDPTKIRFSRYIDPELGPRTFPSPEVWTKIQTPIEGDVSLAIDVPSKSITLVHEGKPIELANRLIYQVVD